jgi:hypothetical protein
MGNPAMTTYTRDDQLAVQPESNFGGRIETSGAYIGRLTLAKERIAKTGTRGIEFTFEAEDGRVARYLTLWVARASGEKIEYPYSLLSALMACLDVKKIDSAPATIDEWNAASGTMVAGEAQVFEALMNKPIGLLLQREEREWEGKTYVSMKIVQFFDPNDRSTPAEIMSGNRSGQALEKMVSNLRETVVRADAPPSGAAPAGDSPGSFAAIDDGDVPF